jgi:hypothetical protein
MQSVRLVEALSDYVEEAAAHLHAEVLAGAEVPYELDTRGRGRGRGPALYCYRALTGEFLAARQVELEGLPGHAEAARLLAAHEGLDRYLAACGLQPARSTAARVRAAIGALLRDVFSEQTDFELQPERLRDALVRLEQTSFSAAGGVTFLATLHGLTLVSPQVALTRGLELAHPDTLAGLPEGALIGGEGGSGDHVLVVFSTAEEDVRTATAQARAVLKDLLRALRLFGDGRVTLGALAWTQIHGGGWNPVALGTGGRPHGMLLVTAEQEDELRAFCNLVSRRAPEGNELAWALRRFELACERESSHEALTDNLLALRALLEPEGPASGLLAGRVAALCATPENRLALTNRMIAAVELERAVITGAAAERGGGEALARDVADHLRALLRDVVCGHLDIDLVVLADEILLELPAPEVEPVEPEPEREPVPAMVGASSKEMFGDLGEAEEVLDLFI